MIPDPDRIKVNATPDVVMCGRHGEPFRARWPVGYPRFALLLIERVFDTDEFCQAVEAMRQARGLCAEEAVQALLHDRPLCCRLTPGGLLEVYNTVQRAEPVWQTGRCELCGEVGLGGPYRRARPTVQAATPMGTYNHVCLHCVCYGNAKPVG